MPPAKLPQCLELVGQEELLQAFLVDNGDQLQSVRPIFLRGEVARLEAAIEREEIQEMLEIEQNIDQKQKIDGEFGT